MTHGQSSAYSERAAALTSCGHAFGRLPPSAAFIHHVMRVRPLIPRKQMGGVAARAVVARVADIDAIKTVEIESPRECECDSVSVVHGPIPSTDLDLRVAFEADSSQTRPALIGCTNLNGWPEYRRTRTRTANHCTSLVHTHYFMGIRGTSGADIWVSNSAPGYDSVWDNLTRERFNALAPVSVIYVESRS